MSRGMHSISSRQVQKYTNRHNVLAYEFQTSLASSLNSISNIPDMLIVEGLIDVSRSLWEPAHSIAETQCRLDQFYNPVQSHTLARNEVNVDSN